MSETKWTPGPWHVVDDHHLRAVLDVRDGDGWDVATLYSGRGDADTQDSSGVWRDDPVRIANANFIAASPELYQALEALIHKGESFRSTVTETLGVRGMDEHDQALQKARAVLAKARGES